MAIASARRGPADARSKARIGLFLVVVAIIATAFNDLKPIFPLGELAPTAFVYIFPALMLYTLAEPERFSLPTLPTVLMILFFVVIILGIATNYHDITRAYFKGRSGGSRVMTQGMSVVFGVLVCAMFYNFTRGGFLEAISRGARLAIVIMAGTGLLELASWYEIPGLTQAHKALSLVIHANSGTFYVQRLRTTAFEVSYTGVILAFVFPFAIMGIPRNDWRRVAYVALVLLLVSFSKSRTAMLVIGSQILVLLWFQTRDRFDRILYVATLGIFAAMLVMINPGTREAVAIKVSNLAVYGNTTGMDGGPEESVSNVTRLAAISAGMSMFQDRPLLGKGLGQYGFNYPSYIKAEDYRSWEVRKYVTSAEEDWPPAFSLHVRMLAELGILGYLIWCALILPPLLRSLQRIDPNTLVGRAHLAVALTLAGWLLLGTSIDSFNFFGGWIALGVGFALPSGQTRSTGAPLPDGVSGSLLPPA
jgi:hypothetical protein